jgi:hypothetical protein
MGDIVITTIQPPTTSVIAMVEKARRDGLGVIAVGDRKTPDTEWPDGSDYLSLARQCELGFTLAALLPENHYARKNIGYLLAMSRHAELIFDTDDDNAPMDAWARRGLQVQARTCTGTGWVNVYKWYSDSQIWPRGFPLENLRSPESHPELGELISCRAPIQQGLANGSPDVDAVWRLTMDEEITFRDNGSVVLPAGAWCPFNSQSTWWFPEAYPLMYLPSFVSFRMTDIWRSFIAQRCLWAMRYGLVFHGPEMYQERNPHNLLRDFEQEIPGYLGNDKICRLLEELNLSTKPEDAGGNLLLCYEELIKAGFVPAAEMALVEAWLKDVSASVAVKRSS